MSESSKKAAGVGRGYTSGNPLKKSVGYLTGTRFITAQDNTGFQARELPNFVATNQRKETTDRQKRRESGYRGL